MNESPLVRKLQAFTNLDATDIAALNALGRNVIKVSRHDDVISEGDRPNYVHLMLKGWAARYKTLPDGSRQILALLIPGDFCDVHVTILREMDHGIVALSPCSVACIAEDQLDQLTAGSARLTKALWWATMVDEGVLRSWIVNVGRRDAAQRIAHLLCEMHAKMRLVGLEHNDRLDLPLTQDELADATGLTPVHVNRMLQRLRGEHLIEIGQGSLTLLDVAGLQAVAGFDPNYLHLKRRGDSG